MLGPHDHGEANGVIRGIVREKIMRFIFCTVLAALVLVFVPIARVQGKARTLVAVWAHADDEGPVAPILARYAREGVQVHMIIATDGAQGAANTSSHEVPRLPSCVWRRHVVRHKRSASIRRVLLGFPDGALGKPAPRNTITPR